MKNFLVTVLFLLALPSAEVWAQDDDVCRYLDVYRDDAGTKNGAAYEPGVDVHGRPVVPADLNDRSGIVSGVIRIPLTVDLAARYGLSVPQGIELEPVIGELIITNDGRVMWGAQDLTAETVAMCREKQLKTEGAVTVNAPDAGENQDHEEADEDLIWGESHLE